jgi:hypothetical protein
LQGFGAVYDTDLRSVGTDDAQLWREDLVIAPCALAC